MISYGQGRLFPMQCLDNKVMGSQFEAIFEKNCNSQGITVRKKPLSARWIGAGKLRLIEGELDFEIMYLGKIAFIDTKAFETDVLRWSNLKEHQVKRAQWYCENQIQAGYVVWFRTINKVVFYSGAQLATLQKGKSLGPGAGKHLGTYESFAIKRIF